MATVPTSQAVVAFNSRATNFYITNNSENTTTSFNTENGVTLSLSEENLNVTSGNNGGEIVFEMDITNRWITASFDLSRGTIAVMAIGNGMVETRSKVSQGGVYGTSTNVSCFTCKLSDYGSLTISVSENIVQMRVKK